jgi:branched-chain amino acid aminotransferase
MHTENHCGLEDNMLEDKTAPLESPAASGPAGPSDPWYSVNGELVPRSEAMIGADDRGVLYGDGCFESLGIWGGRMIHLEESLARIRRSARMLRIDLPSTDELREIVQATASRNGMDRSPAGYLRLLVTRGRGMGVAVPPDVSSPTVLVLARTEVGDYRELPVVRAAVSTHIRQAPAVLDPRIKTLNYLAGVMAALEAEAAGAQIGILRDAAGYVSEAHAMNIVCVQNGTVMTPPTGSALAGITASKVSRVVRELGYDWVERQLTVYDLVNSDEAFTTCSSVGLMAISAIDGIALPAPTPGPITTQLHNGYVEAAFADGVPVPPWRG